jgi:VanZ family protein
MIATPLWGFRGLFVLTLLVVSYLAFAPFPAAGPPLVSDKIQHACAFYVLAGLLDFSWPRHPFGLRKFLVLLAYGLGIECVQYFLPYRESSVFDLLADAVGESLYIASIPLLRRMPVLWQLRAVEDRQGRGQI